MGAFASQQQHRYRLLEALEQIFYSVEGAWIEQIRYHQNSISLNLFSEDPEVIPELLKRFSQSGKFEQVRLQSRSKIQIKGGVTNFFENEHCSRKGKEKQEQ